MQAGLLNLNHSTYGILKSCYEVADRSFGSFGGNRDSRIMALNHQSEEEGNAAELKIGDDFLKAKCLMNCEANILLEHKYEQLKQLSNDARNQVPQVFEKALHYVKRFSWFSNQDAVKLVRGISAIAILTRYLRVLGQHQLTEYELAVLGNLCPETLEEAVAVVPSLRVHVLMIHCPKVNAE